MGNNSDALAPQKKSRQTGWRLGSCNNCLQRRYKLIRRTAEAMGQRHERFALGSHFVQPVQVLHHFGGYASRHAGRQQRSARLVAEGLGGSRFAVEAPKNSSTLSKRETSRSM